jgi:thioredoxin-like negative regulator of GroEL
MSGGTEIIVSDSTFSTRILKSSRPVLVMFTSRGCIACESLSWRLPKPVANAGIGFARCWLHESFETFRRYRIRRTPTLVLFDEGEPLATHDGVAPVPVIEQWIGRSLESRQRELAPAEHGT